MRVNSAIAGLFNPDSHRVRLAVGSGIPSRLLSGAIGIVLLAIFFGASSFTKRSGRDLRAKQVNLIIRQMGHRLLLQAGDSVSRVLPVTEIDDGTFLLEFENEFVFNHDSLIVLAQGLLPKAQFPSGYAVTVQECRKASIVYGFQMSNSSADILACRGRRQPSGCYTIEITFPDLYENVEQKEADIEQPTEEPKSAKVDPHDAHPKFPDSYENVEQKKAEIDPPTEELKSVKVDSQEADIIPITIGTEEFQTTTYPLVNLVYSGMLVFLGVTMLVARFGKILTPVPSSVPIIFGRGQSGERQDQNQAIIKEPVPELPALGKFLFDVKDQRLLPSRLLSEATGIGSEVISLTDKECKILELLNNNFGELIPRETLMQKVWINEGVITGRSLDMFVSKLRKKLSSDPELSITNVHGKGYKLEILGMQIL